MSDGDRQTRKQNNVSDRGGQTPKHMAHIDLKNDLPGIRGPMAFRPETAKPMNALAEILLRDDNNTLSRGDRELIGAYVSSLND